MPSTFKMQIVDTTTGHVAEFEPGGTVETQFVQDCVIRLLSKRVGFFCSRRQVMLEVEDAIKQAILDLKSKVKPRQ